MLDRGKSYSYAGAASRQVVLMQGATMGLSLGRAVDGERRSRGVNRDSLPLDLPLFSNKSVIMSVSIYF